MSFHAGRTIAVAVPPEAACNWLITIGNSLGECSVSSSIQSKPAPAITSAVMLLHRLDHSPICGLPALSACLKWLTGISIVYPLEKPHREGHAGKAQPNRIAK